MIVKYSHERGYKGAEKDPSISLGEQYLVFWIFFGPTGGIQGMKGTLFGIPYTPGSWPDKLIEAFSGTHDLIGGKISGLYDEQGNATRGRSTTQVLINDRWAEVAIPLAAPFAMAEVMPPEVWKAISILLGTSK